MKKYLLMVFTVFLLLFSFSGVYAQETEATAEEFPNIMEEETVEAVPLAQQYPILKIREQFGGYLPIMYYRFSPDVLFFEPIDLSYFPHEKWNKNQWVLLGRWTDGHNYNQILYTDTPAEKMIIHGTETGESRGILRDFYLYATLFIEDNYPKDTGSCYIYYSDSLMIGLNESKGILIDPETGIYEATNSYGGARHTTYTPTTIKHNLEQIQELDPANYVFDPENIEGSSVGAAEYPHLAIDDQFVRDWESLTGTYRMEASPEVKVYRVEIIREQGISTIFINGKKVYSAEDNLKTLDANSIPVPERVSWSYGPILNEGGVTVTCSIGDLIVHSHN
jgi:hypothetical protein